MFYTGSLTVRTRRHHPMPQLQERHLRRHHNLSRRQWQTSFIKPFWILRNYSGEPWLEHPVRMSLRCLWGQILRIRSDMDWNWMKEWSKRQSRTILPWVPRIHLAAKELYFQGNTESLTMLQGVPKKVGFTQWSYIQDNKHQYENATESRPRRNSSGYCHSPDPRSLLIPRFWYINPFSFDIGN